MAPNAHGRENAQNESTDAAANGPPSELPDPVPDFVSDIHAAVSDALADGLGGLGEMINGIAAGFNGGDTAAMFGEVVASIPI